MIPCRGPMGYKIPKRFVLFEFPADFNYLLKEGWEKAVGICERIYQSTRTIANEEGYIPMVRGEEDAVVKESKVKSRVTEDISSGIELLGNICGGKEIYLGFLGEREKRINLGKLNQEKGKLILTILKCEGYIEDQESLLIKICDLIAEAA